MLAVENLHWSDPTSEEWLTALAVQLGGTAILLLATYRPGYWLPWLAHSWATQVALPPLNTPIAWPWCRRCRTQPSSRPASTRR